MKYKILIILLGLILIGLPITKPQLAFAASPEICPDGKSISTAIGCVPVLTDDNGASFANFLLRWAVGIGGGIAFLLILYSAFMIMTSQGNPERLKAGQELLTSALSGLLLLIFSIFVLNFIGINILGIFN